MALQVEDANIGGATPNTQNVKAVGRGQYGFHDVLGGRDYGRSFCERGLIKRHAENDAARQTVLGDEVNGMILTKNSLRDAVRKLRELCPLAIG